LGGVATAVTQGNTELLGVSLLIGKPTVVLMEGFCLELYVHFIYRVAVAPSPLLMRTFIGPLYQPWMIDGDDCGAVGGMNDWQGKPEYWEKTCLSAASCNIHAI
jgi:hypothetical protein